MLDRGQGGAACISDESGTFSFCLHTFCAENAVRFHVVVYLLLGCSSSAFAQNDWCKTLYVAKCASCHAADASGSTYLGKTLNVGDIRAAVKAMTGEQIEQVIVNGKGKMPTNRKLEATQLHGLSAYLRVLAGGATGPPAVCQGPAETTDKLYRANCSSCHGADGKGKNILGQKLKVPDLTSAAVQDLNDQQLSDVISMGKGTMRGYKSALTPEKVARIAEYVRGLAHTREVAAEEASERPNPAATSPATVVPSLATSTSKPAPNSTEATSAQEAKPAEPVAQAKSAELGAASKAKPVASSGPAKSAPVRQLYAAKCSACHGRDGSATGIVGRTMKIRSFASPEVQGQSDDQLAEIIRTGRGKMPAYEKKFSSAQISELVAFIRELAKKGNLP